MTPSPLLRPLLAPRSVALAGASSKPDSIGRIIMENLLDGDFHGTVFAVNPNHRRVLGQRSHPSFAAIGVAVDLALIAVPSAAVRAALVEAARAGTKTAVVFSPPPTKPTAARRWNSELLAAARTRGIRLIGPHSYGLIRTSVGLNATVGTGVARPGKLALIAQSGAVCAAMLAFAAAAGIGFSTVVALGAGTDVGFGELLDSMLNDAETDGILVYVETVGDARRFLSALRAAARMKPVVVLKAGRSTEHVAADMPAPDAVFDAAMRRTGAVRANTYVQLFAAARILAMNRVARGERLAIITNGHGPGTLAADVACDRAIPLAQFSAASERPLISALPRNLPRTNPLNLSADGTPHGYAAALDAVLSDPDVDAVLALHVDRPLIAATDAARAVAAVARTSSKPVLAAWLGAIDRREVDAALEAGGVANFYSPENAVDAFSFLCAYRRNQEWLLEVPPPQPEPSAPDLRGVERIRAGATSTRRSLLTKSEACTVLAAFGLSVPRGRSSSIARNVRPFESCTDIAIGVHVDAAFGPVITVGPPNIPAGRHGVGVVLLPPLNDRLARELVQADRSGFARNLASSAAAIEALARLLVQVSALVCALPWLRTVLLDPVRVGDKGAEIHGARIEIDVLPAVADRPYAHMAIHPYPVEQVGDAKLRDGTTLHVRPIRPEDAELERAFVHGLSDESRYFRFFYQLHELTPAMLARFTQVDYDREMALVAIDGSGAARSIIGVARYIIIVDRVSAEFAIVVADAWHGRGVARLLMTRLVDCARARGLERLEGAVLRGNSRMLKFMADFGASTRDDPEDAEQVIVTIALR